MKKIITFLLMFIGIYVSAQTVQSLSFYADKCSGLKIGTAVGSQFYYEYDTGSTYDKTVKNNFNILVAENEMKYDATEPSKNSFNFTKADLLVAFAQRNNKQVRGHTLCWHSQLPSWLSAGLTNGIANGTYTRATLLPILKNHIQTLVGRYKGKIQQWDVVNEPFSDSGGTLRTSLWQQVIGNDYLDSAFVWAHQVDPDAKLYLNEYGAELYGGTKANAMFNYVTAMKTRGIPITGVGLQCHFTVSKIDFTKLDQNIKRYAANGLDAIITELDIRIAKTDFTADSIQMLNAQAADYQNMIKLCLNNSNAKTFITWGFTDKYSWIPSFTATTGNGPASDYALLFNKAYNQKPAYTAILNELATSAPLALQSQYKDEHLCLKIEHQILNITSDNPLGIVRIINLQGKILFQSYTSANVLQVSLQHWQSGIYVVQQQSLLQNRSYKILI